MKKITISIILAAFAISVNAQDFFDAGIKAGYNTSKISVHSIDYTPQTINNYLFGAFVRLNLGRIYFQPEAYYKSRRGEVIDKVSISTINSFDLKTVDVPALVGIKIINQKSFNLRIMAGPVFSFATDKKAKGIFKEQFLKDNFYGWQYGAGIDLLFLTFDARMENLSSYIYESPNFNSQKGTFVVSLGIKLF